jgi:hypothetical protein
MLVIVMLWLLFVLCTFGNLMQSTQRVLTTYTNWDVDGNGTLSKNEFSAISQVGCPLSQHRKSISGPI